MISVSSTSPIHTDNTTQQISSLKQKIRMLEGEKKRVVENKNLPDAERKQRIREIQQQIEQLRQQLAQLERSAGSPPHAPHETRTTPQQSTDKPHTPTPTAQSAFSEWA